MSVINWQINDQDLALLGIALAEDLGQPFRDVTTDTLLSDLNSTSTARIVSKHPEPIILCGLPIITALLRQLSPHGVLEPCYQEGDWVPGGETLLLIHDAAPHLLKLERTLLNFLQRLSAIATLTKQFVQRVQHTRAQILDTRKTLPGFRHLDKYAVACGGGVNHRMGLYDAMMIKDTHIDVLGGMRQALDRLSVDAIRRYPVIVEVRDENELAIVLEMGRTKVSRVLLDNMPLTLLQHCVTRCAGVMPTEASGNVTLDNVAAIAETGVDYISVGRLTHSAGNVDLSMRCQINHE